MRLLGVGLLLFGGGAIGLLRALRLTRQLRTLQALMQALSYMARSLDALSLPLSALFRQLSRYPGDCGAFFETLSQRLGEELFPALWRASLACLYLPESCRAALEPLGDILGALDAHQQSLALDSTTIQLQAISISLSQAHKDAWRTGLAVPLCLAGMLAVLLF